MKATTFITLFCCLFSPVALANAAIQIEFQTITLLRGAPSEDEIARMIDSGQLADTSGLSSKADAAGVFSIDKTKIFRLATEFDGNGNVLKFEDKPIGRTLSGTALEVNNLFDLQIRYTEYVKIGDAIYTTDRGLAFSQPVLEASTFASAVTAKPGRWIVIKKEGAKPEEKSYIAVRVRKISEQSSTGQPATSPESKSEGGDKPQLESEGLSR